MAEFRDQTGRPGPATWVAGDYAGGQADFPVTGVSWYEAGAYANFVGKSLPTIHHWIWAAGTSMGSSILPLSNIDDTGPVAVGSRQAMSPFGTHDMAGNVREWCWNASGDLRYILGGAWSDRPYMFSFARVRAPFDRSDINGFRLVDYAGGDGVSGPAGGPVELLTRDYDGERPVPDAVFEAFRERFAYDPVALNTAVEDGTAATEDWTLDTVSFDAAYPDQRVMARIMRPTSGSPPYQTVVVFPGSEAALFVPSSEAYATVLASGLVDFLLKSGRALVLPGLQGHVRATGWADLHLA